MSIIAASWAAVRAGPMSDWIRHGLGRAYREVRCPREPTWSVRSNRSEKCQIRKSSVLFDHFVGAVEQRQWDGEAERLRGFEIDHQFELGRQLHGKIARLCSFQNLVDVSGCTAIGVGDA